MNATMKKDAPPYVRFDYVEYGINAEATAKAGRPIPAVVPFAFIMQHGSRDTVEKPADEWLAQKEREAIDGRYNPEWVQRHKLQYEAFLKGNDLPRDGTPIRTWLAVTREQGTRLLALGITTVEDLAAIPDSGLGNIGLDGRNLRDLAKNFIDAGQGVGVMAKKLSDLEQSNRDKDDQIQRMSERLAALEKTGTLHAKKAA